MTQNRLIKRNLGNRIKLGNTVLGSLFIVYRKESSEFNSASATSFAKVNLVV